MTAGSSQKALCRFFAGLAEGTFQTRLGVADPPLIDYISGLLARFVHCDVIYKVRSVTGKRLDQVADMLQEADARVGSPRREVHRHIGDFALFWTGVYPEALRRLQGETNKDHFLDYCQQGKRAYYIASTINTEDVASENDVLARLSYEFELCAYGLSEVRRAWERHRPKDGPPFRPLLFN